MHPDRYLITAAAAARRGRLLAEAEGARRATAARDGRRATGMETEGFDRFAKALGAGASRRAVLRHLGTGALGALALGLAGRGAAAACITESADACFGAGGNRFTQSGGTKTCSVTTTTTRPSACNARYTATVQTTTVTTADGTACTAGAPTATVTCRNRSGGGPVVTDPKKCC